MTVDKSSNTGEDLIAYDIIVCWEIKALESNIIGILGGREKTEIWKIFTLKISWFYFLIFITFKVWFCVCVCWDAKNEPVFFLQDYIFFNLTENSIFTLNRNGELFAGKKRTSHFEDYLLLLQTVLRITLLFLKKLFFFFSRLHHRWAIVIFFQCSLFWS